MARVGLIERDEVLGALRSTVADVRAGGHGRLVLVAGEAGSGKTAVVRDLVGSLPPGLPWLWGSCDNLRTPRPFGPVGELAADRDPSLAAAIAAGAPRQAVFDRVLDVLRDPAVAVVDDVHWADEATIDLVSYLGRRLDRTRSVLVVTYRADEVGPGHPLFVALGDLATTSPVRLQVGPLSVEGVAALAAEAAESAEAAEAAEAADHDVDPAELHARTGGNAFFVTECLSAGGDVVPETVREAVLARAAGLSAAGRAALDVVAAVPGRTDLWLADGLGAGGAGLDECVAHGVLVAAGTGVAFRHELARVAVHDAVPPVRRREIHRRALALLAAPPDGFVDHARLVHHAEEAGVVDAVLRNGPAAARLAARAGARRQAAAHLELTLRYEARLGPGAAADLWAQLAQQWFDLGRHLDAVGAYDRAVELVRALGDDERRGELLARLIGALTMVGQEKRAVAAETEALSVLEGLDPGPALARTYAQRSSRHMLARELAEAEPWGRRAIDLATELGARDIVAYASIQSGVALWMAGRDEGLIRLQRGIDVARSEGLTGLVALGLGQIGSGGGEVRRYDRAVPALEECIAFAERTELAGAGLYAQAWLARCRFEQGRWGDASTTLARVLRSRRCEGITRMTALTVTGRLRARRGDPEVWPALDEALGLARETGHLQRLWPVAAARAEAAWLEDRLGAEVTLLGEVHDEAARLGYGWASGELGFWLWRAGALGRVDGAEPFVLHAGGRPREAAARWEALGCPYEQAAALADVVADPSAGVDETDDAGATDDADAEAGAAGEGADPSAGAEAAPADGGDPSSADADRPAAAGVNGVEADLRAALAIFDGLGAVPARTRVTDLLRDAGLVVPRGPNAATRGNPGGLTDREIDVLRLVAAGSSNPEIAARLRISAKTVGHHVSHLLTKLGARSRAEAVAAAAEVGLPLDRSAR